MLCKYCGSEMFKAEKQGTPAWECGRCEHWVAEQGYEICGDLSSVRCQCEGCIRES
jgi:hypothetical protein